MVQKTTTSSWKINNGALLNRKIITCINNFLIFYFAFCILYYSAGMLNEERKIKNLKVKLFMQIQDPSPASLSGRDPLKRLPQVHSVPFPGN